MKLQRTKTELACWGALALAGGLVAGWIDSGPTAAQSPALVLMMVAFVLSLPGRAPVSLIAILSSVGIPLVHAVWMHDLNPGLVLVLIPAFIGAAGGRFAGAFLDGAARTIDGGAGQSVVGGRGLSTRVLLSISLATAAAAGFPLVLGMFELVGHRAPGWTAAVWQIMTLLGWIGVARPILVHRRRAGTRHSIGGVGGEEFVRGLATAVALSAVHVVVLLVLSAALFIPVTPGWSELWRDAFAVYLPLDLLVYLSIRALGAASDADALRRESAQREAALQSSLLEGRLSALRARLNPHFLFNALNSVQVLARAGRVEETTGMIEGLTSLLRYVLDDRSATVPLRDEIEFARQYLGLQQMRFGERLKYEIAHDDALDDAAVPQLILQPIVENAVEHGVGDSLDGGTVRVRSERVGGALRLVVEDDGAGLADSSQFDGIGLSSTRQRLDSLYGERASLSINGPRAGKSDAEKRASAATGTRVEILLPIDEAPAEPAAAR